MFLFTPGLRFPEIINYLGPGTSDEKWSNAYECKQTKSWFPYEWFDSPKNLSFPVLPDYSEWYSKQKAGYLLSQEEWQSCKKVFQEKGMKTFANWLQHYNNPDVVPFLEALGKMGSFYGERGVDILKGAVSLPGVSLQYLMRGTLSGSIELYSPGKKAYNMLKTAIVGGPSIVFTIIYEAGRTKIRDH